MMAFDHWNQLVVEGSFPLQNVFSSKWRSTRLGWKLLLRICYRKAEIIILSIFYQNPYTLSFLKLNMVNYLIIFMNRKCYSIAKPSKVQFIWQNLEDMKNFALFTDMPIEHYHVFFKSSSHTKTI